MKKPNVVRLAALSSTVGLSVLSMAFATAALAQEPAAARPAAPAPASAQAQPQASAAMPAPVAAPAQNEEAMADEPEVLYEYERVQVGDATQDLLAWQRSGEIASPTPRPIAGNVANRSYERYLKSFEFPIPERMNSTVKTSGGSGSGSGSSSAAPR